LNKLLKSLLNLTEAQLVTLAENLSPFFKTGDVIALSGDLGMGKSTFARAFIKKYMDNKEEEVPSPTYTLVQQFIPKNTSRPEIWHFDMYRLENPKDALELGIEDAFSEGVSIIEWPQNLGTFLPVNSLIIKIKNGEKIDNRTLEFYGNSSFKNRLQNILADNDKYNPKETY
jgi:tRNA threonylcarbamoyladenosine biosynthesis protein TsaE